MQLLKNFVLGRYNLVIAGLVAITMIFGLCFYKNQTAQAFVPSFDAGYAVYPILDDSIPRYGYEVWDPLKNRTFYPLTTVPTPSDLNPTAMPMFDPDGNLYILDTDMATFFHINCYTYKSHYSQSCLNPYIDLSAFFGGIGQPVSFRMDNERNIWASLYTSNTQVVKMPAATNYASIDWQIYEATGKVCSDPTYKNDYTACIAHSGSMVGGLSGFPLAANMDYYGNIWVTIWADHDVPMLTCLNGLANFEYCQGDIFDNDYGAIFVTHLPITPIYDSNKNMYVGDYYTANIIKMETATSGTQNFTRTTININDYGYAGANSIRALVTDLNDYIWIGEDNTGYVDCYNPKTNTSCGEYNLGIGEDISAITVDKNNDIWVTDQDNNRVFIMDSSNNYAITTYTLASGSYFGSPTGLDTNNLCKYLGSCTLTDYTDVNISGLVDPILKFDIVSYSDSYVDTSTCALGTLLANTVASCQYRIGVGTNGSRGFTTYIQDTQTSASLQGLRANSYASQIDDVSDNLVDGVGTIEEYGLRVDGAPPTGISTGTNFTVNQDKPISYSSADIILSSAVPIEYIKDSDADDTTIIKHSVIIQQGTPAGYYTQTIRYTVTGNF